jgi:osmotically inducible protein OsmC
MKRTASAVWTGGLKDGEGSLSTQSGVLANTPYGFNTRFEMGPGTNPEELIAAAHAGCFTMALAAQLSKSNLKAKKLETNALVTLENIDDEFWITAVHLELIADIADIDQPTFEALTSKVKADCPVSKLLNAKITLDAKLNT